ncbi:hypothetical protein MMC13_004960 [Lambiella insularis]|nr:hypothetical protein [Lambiella insularis]
MNEVEEMQKNRVEVIVIDKDTFELMDRITDLIGYRKKFESGIILTVAIMLMVMKTDGVITRDTGPSDYESIPIGRLYSCSNPPMSMPLAKCALRKFIEGISSRWIKLPIAPAHDTGIWLFSESHHNHPGPVFNMCPNVCYSKMEIYTRQAIVPMTGVIFANEDPYTTTRMVAKWISHGYLQVSGKATPLLRSSTTTDEHNEKHDLQLELQMP